MAAMDSAATVSSDLLTPEAYLEMEVASSDRHEFRQGQVIKMTGGTPNHNEIAGNLFLLLKLALKGLPYKVFIADQRLWLPESAMYTYPDVMVVPSPVTLQPGRTDTVMEPVAIAEVLSASTRNYDRDEKFAAYRSLPTFQDYLLIDQYTMTVEHYARQDTDQWLLTLLSVPTAEIQMDAISVTLKVGELYDGVAF
ncbi:MAG: Uma2 family endonuclease [Cyanobacteria bacterium P01_C01_bin.89]